MFIKIFNRDDCHHGFQFHDGLNVDTVPFNPNGTCQPGGLYFTTKKHVCEFLDFGSFVREVTVPDDAIVYHEDRKSKADRLFLHERRSLAEAETWDWLIKAGADVHADNDCAIRWASEHGHTSVVELLKKHG